LLSSVPRLHTAINGTSGLRAGPCSLQWGPNFFQSSWAPNLYYNHWWYMCYWVLVSDRWRKSVDGWL